MYSIVAVYFPASNAIDLVPIPFITFTMIFLPEIVTVYSPSISAVTFIVVFCGYSVFSPVTIMLFIVYLIVIVMFLLVYA